MEHEMEQGELCITRVPSCLYLIPSLGDDPVTKDSKPEVRATS